MTSKIDVLVFDGLQDTPVAMAIENDIDAFHEVINCDTFEVYGNTAVGRLFQLDIYLDGNGKIREDKPRITGFFVSRETGRIVDTLVGNILFARHDEEGESISVSSIDKDLLSFHFIKARKDTNIPEVWSDGYGEFEVSPYLLILPCCSW